MRKRIGNLGFDPLGEAFVPGASVDLSAAETAELQRFLSLVD